MFKKILAVVAALATATCLSVSAFAAGETATHDKGAVSVNGYTVVENATQYTVMIFKDGFEITDPETGVTTYDTNQIYYINQGPDVATLLNGMLVKATTVSGVTSNDLPVGTYTVRIGNDAGAATDITLEVKEDVVAIVYGDVTGDGKINAKDVAFIARYVAKWSGYDETTVDLEAANVTGDTKVNAKDVAYIARYVAKWSGYETLPKLD